MRWWKLGEELLCSASHECLSQVPWEVLSLCFTSQHPHAEVLGVGINLEELKKGCPTSLQNSNLFHVCSFQLSDTWFHQIQRVEVNTNHVLLYIEQVRTDPGLTVGHTVSSAVH